MGMISTKFKGIHWKLISNICDESICRKSKVAHNINDEMRIPTQIGNIFNIYRHSFPLKLTKTVRMLKMSVKTFCLSVNWPDLYYEVCLTDAVYSFP